MPYKVVYFDEVKNDVREAKQWYAQLEKALAKRFAASIKAAVIRISEQPFSHAVRYQNIRITHPDVFPYAIHYYVDNNLVVIVAIIHNSRDSSFMNKRL